MHAPKTAFTKKKAYVQKKTAEHKTNISAVVLFARIFSLKRKTIDQALISLTRSKTLLKGIISTPLFLIFSFPIALKGTAILVKPNLDASFIRWSMP